MREKDVVHKLFEEAKQRFGKVNGGYTRITKIGRRPGDAALVSVIELIAGDAKPKKEKAKTVAKQEAPAKEAASETVETAKEETPEEEAAVEAESAEETEKAEAQTEAAAQEAVEEEAAESQEDQEATDEKKSD